MFINTGGLELSSPPVLLMERYAHMQNGTQTKLLSYEEAVNLINDLPKFTTKHSPEESRQFLELLCHPEQNKCIMHVAGTNGKGSVCAYMESILLKAGKSTGVFISPHLVDMCERIRINGQSCSKEDFAYAATKVYEIAKKSFFPTFFEFIFFMGLLVFDKANVDILILETGLGGRLDATNLPYKKDLAVITSIGLDHMEYLGDTVEEIAVEKAGIMRPDTPVVYWKNDVSDVLTKEAEAVGACCYLLEKDKVSGINLDKEDIDFCLRYKYDTDIYLSVHTRALYQVYNASLAVYALGVWDTEGILTADCIRQGVADTFWPGRMEEIEPHIILDGAHNVPGTEEFLRSVAIDKALKRILIYGCMHDKQYMEEIKMISDSGLFDYVVAVGLSYGRALPVEIVASSFVAAGADCMIAADVSQALTIAREYTQLDEKNYAYVAGSLYLIGEVRGLYDRF